MFGRLKSLLNPAAPTNSITTPAPSDTGYPVSHGDTAPLQSKPATIAPSVRTETGISFPVDDVAPATGALRMITLGESMEIRADASMLVMPDHAIPAVAPEGYTAANQSARERTFLHPLIEAVHLAFSDHRPLVLTPDCIWLTIMQGFGHHVNENAEALRRRIVGHRGKKELWVQTKSIDPASWPGLIAEFSAKIKENSDPVLHETLLCQFSTTTPTIKTACEIALMDTYQRYFDYGLMCVCGIPTVTLEGTAEDWQRMRTRIEVLATFDLGWWTSKLAPILDQFIATSEGNPDRTFWQAIYKPQKLYASRMATGWITDLFPYLFGVAEEHVGTGRGLCAAAAWRNQMLGEERVDWVPVRPANRKVLPGVDLSSFPSGISRAPVKIRFLDRPAMDVFLVGGFLGISQRSGDNALSPIINWAAVPREA